MLSPMHGSANRKAGLGFKVKNMVQKRYCDVCGVEIPDSAACSHNEAAEMFSATFCYSALIMDEMDDLCQECGGKVRDFIRQLKKKMK